MIIKSRFPKAVYVHCAAHALNLCVVAACSVQLVKNMMGTSGVSRIFVRGVLSFGLLYDCACVNPKCYPCDFRTHRGPRQVVVLYTSGVVGSLETCSARVYQSSRKFSEAIFAHLSRSAQGRFTGDGGSLGGVFQHTVTRSRLRA